MKLSGLIGIFVLLSGVCFTYADLFDDLNERRISYNYNEFIVPGPTPGNQYVFLGGPQHPECNPYACRIITSQRFKCGYVRAHNQGEYDPDLHDNIYYDAVADKLILSYCMAEFVSPN